MGRRVKVSSKPLKVIHVTSSRLRSVDRESVAKALGAELVKDGVPKSVVPVRDSRRNGKTEHD